MKKVSSLIFFLFICQVGFAQETTPAYSGETPGSGNGFLFFLLDNDGGVSEINSIPVYQCDALISPEVIIQNFGTNTLTTATLEYRIDGGSSFFFDWEGSLFPYFSDTVSLPSLFVSPGTHTLTISVVKANGEIDFNGLNDNSIEFNIVGSGEPAPYSENFQAVSLPEGFFVQNDNGGASWMPSAIQYDLAEEGCMLMPFYSNDAELDSDLLFIKNIDLSGIEAAQLVFDVAYTYYSDYYFDELQVEISVDCGSTWQLVYSKQKETLATAPFTDVYFTPAADEWRTETVDLFPFSNQANVMIRFAGLNGHGNNLYLDNISIGGTVGISGEVSGPGSRVFPNPADDVFEITLAAFTNQEVTAELFDELGRMVMKKSFRAGDSFRLPVGHLPDGHYAFKVAGENQLFISTMVVIAH